MDVLLVEDHPLIHEVLRAAVESAIPGSKMHGETTLAGALELAKRLKRLELVLLDLGLPGCAGIEAFHRFRKTFPKVSIAIVSATDDPDCVRDCLDAGAVGYIPKTSKASVILAALKVIAAGGRYLPPEILSPPSETARVPRKSRAGPNAAALGLTERQLDVMRLMMKGCTNREIAESLDISEGTVKQHAHAIFQMLGVSTRTQALIAARRRGIRPG